MCMSQWEVCLDKHWKTDTQYYYVSECHRDKNTLYA